MTQTNDSELEKWDKAISDEIENQGRDMEIAINNVLNIVHELRDQAFAAGEKSGIAKTEKEFLVFLEPFLKPCNTLEELETFNENVEKMTAKLKNL